VRVIRTRNFDRRAKRAGVDEEDLADLIGALADRPVGAVIPRTGGARETLGIDLPPNLLVRADEIIE
jgi:hypothetical protein